MERTWRTIAAPIIRKVIAEVGTEDHKKLRAALQRAYPFGERKYHPYKIWLDEIRRQLGTKTPREPVYRTASRLEKNTGQGDLWHPEGGRKWYA